MIQGYAAELQALRTTLLPMQTRYLLVASLITGAVILVAGAWKLFTLL